MITIVLLGADPPTNFWVRAEFTRALPRLRNIRLDRRNGALHTAHFVSL